jgi:hypothetical protein
MVFKHKFYYIFFILLLLVPACSKNSAEGELLASFPLDSIEGVITRDGVEFDKTTSADGSGSLKITASGDRIVQLFETGNLNAEDCVLYYRAKIKTENLSGQAYLMMLCHFTGKGEFFSKGLGAVKSGNMDWSTAETVFLLKKGENPDNIKLQLVINGNGIIWIDDVELVKTTNKKSNGQE